MAKDDEVTFLATNGMLQGETGFTTVTAFCTVNRTELSCGELSPVDGRGENRQPSSSMFSSLDGAASPFW